MTDHCVILNFPARVSQGAVERRSAHHKPDGEVYETVVARTLSNAFQASCETGLALADAQRPGSERQAYLKTALEAAKRTLLFTLMAGPHEAADIPILEELMAQHLKHQNGSSR